jgi:hypothetical protein
MKNFLLGPICVLAFLVVLACGASAQERVTETRVNDDNIVLDAAKGLGKTGIIVVGSAAKVTWVTTKFTAKYVAKPVAKTIIVKAPPAAAKFALKSSGTAAKHLLPIAVKLALL